jgi:hypothetical protein
MTTYERQMLQDALIWVSDYVGLKDGAWGRMSDTALRNWLRVANSPNPSLLTNTDVGTLLFLADAAKEQVGWKVWRDPAMQAHVGYPAGLVTVRQEADGKGTIYEGNQGFYLVTRVLTESLAEMRETLNALGVADGNTPGYRLDKPDRQVITASRPGMTMYVRFDRVGIEWRGFIVMVRANDPRLSKLITAVSTEFSASGQSVFADRAIETTEPGFRAWLSMAGKRRSLRTSNCCRSTDPTCGAVSCPLSCDSARRCACSATTASYRPAYGFWNRLCGTPGRHHADQRARGEVLLPPGPADRRGRQGNRHQYQAGPRPVAGRETVQQRSALSARSNH